MSELLLIICSLPALPAYLPAFAKTSRITIIYSPVYLRRDLEDSLTLSACLPLQRYLEQLSPTCLLIYKNNSIISYLFICLSAYLPIYLFICLPYNTIIRLLIINSDREKETSESTRIQELETINRDLNITILDLNTIIARLRASRDLHRLNIKTVTAKNEKLKTKIKALTVKETIVLKPLDFDAEDTSIKMKFSTKKIITQHIESGENKKYPDVPLFYGDKDK